MINTTIKSLLFITVFMIFDSQSATYYREWKFADSVGGENFLEMTVEKNPRYPIEANLWISRINCYQQNSVYSDTYKYKGKLIYKARYTMGELGFRKVIHNNHNAKSHVILAGDSNIFGIGVNDQETIAQNLAYLSKANFLYNLGLPGSSPSNLLYLMESYPISNLVPAKRIRGTMIYTFYDFLVERIIGSKNTIGWTGPYPNYELDDNGEVYFAGTLDQLLAADFYKFLNKFNFIHRLIPNLPRISRTDIFKAAKILKKIKELYLKETLEENRFIVVLRDDLYVKAPYNPPIINGAEEGLRILHTLEEMLKKEGVEVILASNHLKEKVTAFENNGHIDANGARVYAKLLSDIIK